MEAIRQHHTNPVPSWLQIRYGQLWEKFTHNSFSSTEAKEVLKESKEIVNVILSRLRKSGWAEVSFDEKDFRKRKYTLNEPSIIFRKIKGVKKEDEQDKQD